MYLFSRRPGQYFGYKICVPRFQRTWKKKKKLRRPTVSVHFYDKFTAKRASLYRNIAQQQQSACTAAGCGYSAAQKNSKTCPETRAPTTCRPMPATLLRPRLSNTVLLLCTYIFYIGIYRNYYRATNTDYRVGGKSAMVDHRKRLLNRRRRRRRQRRHVLSYIFRERERPSRTAVPVHRPCAVLSPPPPPPPPPNRPKTAGENAWRDRVWKRYIVYILQSIIIPLGVSRDLSRGKDIRWWLFTLIFSLYRPCIHTDSTNRS